jgi:molybdate transport system substrate-binding protein
VRRRSRRGRAGPPATRPVPWAVPVAVPVAVLVAVLVALVAGGCGGDGREAGGPAAADRGSSGQGPTGELVVFAAASLTEAFERLGSRLEARHSGLEVTFSFGGSSSLGPQIAAGAPADVFASADRRTMGRVVAAGAVGPPVVFARNRLQVAVPPGNPGDVRGLADFARDDLAVAVCAPQVPCGAAARRAFDRAGVAPRPDTLEEDVKAVLTKVELGEVDAGLVYRTDVRAAGARVQGVTVPARHQAVNEYVVAPVAGSDAEAAARLFLRRLRSAPGRKVLEDAGFDLP